jgi:hypothetical protein
MYDSLPFFEYLPGELLALELFVNHSHANDDDELLHCADLVKYCQKEKQIAKSTHTWL